MRRFLLGMVLLASIGLSSCSLIGQSNLSGRFLPSIQIVDKEPRSLLKVEILQTESAAQWIMNPLGELEILPLTHASLGLITLKDLPNLLAQHFGFGDVNVLLPVGGTYVENEEYEVFQTHGSMTVILLPLSFTNTGGSGLTAPAIIEGIPWFSISTQVLTLQTTKITDMIRQSSSSRIF